MKLYDISKEIFSAAVFPGTRRPPSSPPSAWRKGATAT